jgi:Core-2/I-Branching enzyme
VNLAYIVSAYKLPDQLVRLVRRLNGEGVYFFIHVDRNAGRSVYQRMYVHLSSFPNVHFLSRHRCYYGDFGHVKATLKGIRELFCHRIPFDYAILLTGQDYPIKPVQQIADFFRQTDGQSFVEYFPLPHEEWEHGGIDRFSYWHVRFGRSHFQIPGRSRAAFQHRFPSLRLFGGSAYWCLSRECTEYIYRFLQDHPSYERFFRYADVPDEAFFQTVLLNSPLEKRIVNDDLRLIEWRNPESAGGPAILRKEDFPKITRSSKLFARKFDITEDEEILDLIDEFIAGA